MNEQVSNAIADAGESGIGRVFESIRDGKITHDEGEDILVALFSAAIDVSATALNVAYPGVGTAVDVIASPLAPTIATELYETLDDALQRDPNRVRARAERAKRRGNEKRAERLTRLASKLEAKAAPSAGQPA